METLTLPEPARTLWRATRDIIHGVPPEATGRVVRPHLGGGTVLAARLRHRLSTDIDVFLPGRYSLISLVQDDETNVIRRLGGTAESVSGARIKVALPNGKVDLSIVRPVPSEGQHEAWIDGRQEMVLTNAQILRGKLDRPERVLVRDVVDVLLAAEADPSALATAASLLTPERAAAVANSGGTRTRCSAASSRHESRCWNRRGSSIGRNWVRRRPRRCSGTAIGGS